MEKTLLTQIAKIRNYERGHWAFQVIQTGLRFGLLQAICDSSEGCTPEELAVQLMLHEPFLRVWCQTAFHFEILDGDSRGRFRLQPFLDQALGLEAFSSSCPSFGGGAFQDGRSFLQDNDPLSYYIRSGKKVGLSPSGMGSPGRFPTTRNLILVFTSMVFPEEGQRERRLSQGCRMLEIGCGRGGLLLDLARCYKNSRFTGVDPDVSAVGWAEEAAERAGLMDRVSFFPIGGEETDFRECMDVVLMVLTLHEILPDLRPRVLYKAYQALTSNGELWILDYPYPGRIEDFRDPRFEYGIIEQYFEAPFGIVHLSPENQERLLRQAGFEEITRRPIGEGGRLDWLTARKGSERLEK